MFTRAPHGRAAIREHHRQNLEHASASIENTPREKRYLSSLTVATNARAYDEALEKIDAFLKKLDATLSRGAGHD